MTKVYEVAVIVEAPDGKKEPLLFDAIEGEGYFWLVPQWIEDTAGQQRKPARVIRLDGLKPLPRGPQDDCDFFVPQIMSTGLLYGDPSPEEARRYVIQDSPDLTSARQIGLRKH